MPDDSGVTNGELERDVETVMARIRETMVEQALDDDVAYPTFAAARAKGDGRRTRFPEEAYYQLEQANLNYDKVLAELTQVESQMPLLGMFVNHFKRELHQLVVFYVNMVAERQVVVNDAMVQTLNLLVDRLETGALDLTVGGGDRSASATSSAGTAWSPTIQSLNSEVEDLRERLESLEARMSDQGFEE